MLNIYESTIEKLHRQIEYLNVKGSVTKVKSSKKAANEDNDMAYSSTKKNTEDRNVVKNLLKDIELLK